MNNKFRIRSYQNGDEDNIVKLLEQVFNGWPKFDLEHPPLDHWRWKYLDNPCGESPICLAVSDGDIIGCAHTVPSRAKIGDLTFTISYGPDLAVDPEFRRIGIWKNMRDSLKELRPKINVNISLSITNNPIVYSSLVKTLPYIPIDVFEFVKINDLSLHCTMRNIKNSWIKKRGYQLFSIINKIRTILTNPSAPSDIINISEIEKFDERIDIFWSKIKNHHDFIYEITKKYLNWRYCDLRAGKFIIKIAEEKKEIIGYLVLRINKYQTNYPVGYIADLIALPNRLDVVENLVIEAVNYFNSKNINIAQCILTKGHPYEKIYKKHGFVNSRKKITIFYNIYREINEFKKIKLITPERTHIAYGNYDFL